MNSRWLERVKEFTAVYALRHGRSTRGDAQLFTDLFNATYPRKIPAGYYSWQFFGGAFPGVCLFAEVGGKLAGCIGLRVLPIEGAIKGRVGLVVDLIITPEHQRTGLLARLEMEIEAQARALGCGCLVGLSNLAAYEPRINALGWTAMPRKGSWRCETSLVRTDRQLLQFIPSQGSFESIEPVIADFTATHAHLAFIERSTEMLNWRFIRNPWYAYQAFLVCLDSAPVGWLVLKEFTDPTSGQRYGDIVDLVWSQSGAAHLPEILSFANRTFFNAGIPDSTIWLDTHTELDQVGVDYGYQPLGGGRYFACKTLSESYTPLLESSTWFQTPYDTDLY